MSRIWPYMGHTWTRHEREGRDSNPRLPRSQRGASTRHLPPSRGAGCLAGVPLDAIGLSPLAHAVPRVDVELKPPGYMHGSPNHDAYLRISSSVQAGQLHSGIDTLV